jgi:hypothetical protein
MLKLKFAGMFHLILPLQRKPEVSFRPAPMTEHAQFTCSPATRLVLSAPAWKAGAANEPWAAFHCL